MEEMQQKGEAWKVLHHLYITYKENKTLGTTQNNSHTHTHSHMHTTVCLRNSRGKEQKNLQECCIEMNQHHLII